jgi:S1-C subfamily serine protease
MADYDPVKDRQQRLIKTIIGLIIIAAVVIGLGWVLTKVAETSKVISETIAEDVVDKLYPPEEIKETEDMVKRAKKRIAEDAKEDEAEQDTEPTTQFELPTIEVKMDILKDLPPPVAEVAKHVRPVRIVFDNGEFKFGTGILIGNGYLMTCGHLARNKHGAMPDYVQYTCKKDDGSLETSDPILINPVTDTAFVKVDCESEPLEWRDEAQTGITVWVVGIEYNGMNGLILSSVTQSGPRLDQMKQFEEDLEKLNQDEWINLLRDGGLEIPGTIFTQIRYGNSGSLVIDTDGRVVGMVIKGAVMPFGVYMPTNNLRHTAEELGVDLGENDDE